VVVTATKRKEIAAELPYSLTVASAQEVADARARSTNDLTTEVAQLTATNLGAGQDKIFLRGLTDSIVAGLSESVVGIYLDEVGIGDDAPDPDLELVDVDRIEVLNGPQGTLYGAGSLGGLVRIVTHQPEMDEFQTIASASVGQTKYGGISDDANMVVNIPLSDNELALRAVVYARRDSGYIDETRLGIPNANWTSFGGGRAALKWEPSGDWSATAAVTYQGIKAGDAQYLDETAPSFKRNNYVLEPHADMFLDGSLTVAGDLGFANFLSASAVVNRQLQERFDASLAWPILTGFPIGPSPFDDSRRILSYTHESRLLSEQDRRWKWLVGLFLSHRDEDFHARLMGPDHAGGRIVARNETREDIANEAALFGELTYALTDEISLTGGLRVFNASRNVKASIASILGDAGAFRGSNSQTGATPKLVLAYTPGPALMLYAQITEGYRLGGLNVDGPAASTAGEDDNAFDSDTLWNYELGAKAKLFDGIVQANGAAYFDRWNNVQTDQVGHDGSFFILNAGTVEDMGTEADVTVGPLYNFTLRGNFFWNNAHLLNANPLLVQSEGVLPAAPRTKFGINVRYDLPVWGMDAFLAADYGYIGKSHLGFDESAPTMGGYHIANLRAGVVVGPWEALVFVNNLQREDENTFGFGDPFDPNAQVTPPRPRTVGFSLSWHS
jgi:outer membrane receptor protein involved in Fe transport